MKWLRDRLLMIIAFCGCKSQSLGLIVISTVALVCEEKCLLWIWVMNRKDLAFLLLSRFCLGWQSLQFNSIQVKTYCYNFESFNLKDYTTRI